MPETIRDGTGSGYLAKVTDDNALYIHGSVENMGLHKAVENSEYFAASFSSQATGVADVVGYIKNSSTTKNMIIDFFSVYSSAATQLHVHLNGSGTPSGGSTVVPANSTSGSGVAADGVFQQGSDITGLSGSTNIYVSVTPADETKVYRDVPIVLPPNQTMHFINYQNTATAYIGVGFYYYGGD